MKRWNEKKIAYLRRKHVPIKKYWFHDDVFKSSFFDASSIIIPSAEEYIIELVQKMEHLIRNKKLVKEKNHLIDEESAHSKVHNAYNRMLEGEGYDINAYRKSLQKLQTFLFKYLSLKSQLAVCAGIEHMTASMSLLAIDYGIMDVGIDERMRKVWLWHFLEEIDHRSVTFDIYTYLGGGYIRRVLVMLGVQCIFFWHTIRIRTGLLRQSGHLTDVHVHVAGWKFLWGKNGFHKKILLPLAGYFAPNFHPSNMKYKHLAKHDIHRYKIEKELMSYFPKV